MPITQSIDALNRRRRDEPRCIMKIFHIAVHVSTYLHYPDFTLVTETSLTTEREAAMSGLGSLLSKRKELDGAAQPN